MPNNKEQTGKITSVSIKNQSQKAVKVNGKRVIPPTQKQGQVLVVKTKRAKGKKRIRPEQKIPFSLSETQTSALTVNCNVVPEALTLAFVGFASYLVNKGLINNKQTTGLDGPWNAVYGGSAVLQLAVARMMQNTMSIVDEMPRVVRDLAAALSPKTVPFGPYGKASFAWKAFQEGAHNLTHGINMGYGVWKPTFVTSDSDDESPIGSAQVWTGAGLDSYTELVRLLASAGHHKLLESVPLKTKTALDKDVSSFARVYVYNGLQAVPTGGFYKDAELEVPIRSPLYANFCSYGSDDRVPRWLAATSGDAAATLASRLFPTFDTVTSRCPDIYKQVDIREFAITLALWMAYLKEHNCTINSNTNEYSKPLPFTWQEFLLVVRQAIIANAPHQCYTQFTGTTGVQNGSNNFAPLMVMGHCGANARFSTFTVPVIINENLAALQARQVIYRDAQGNDQTCCYKPVFGAYKDDIAPDILFNNGGRGEKNMIPLFAPTTPDETQINLFDCSYGPNHSYVDVNNAYYQTVMDDWNSHVTGLSQFSCETCSLKVDGGAEGMGILYMTKVEKFIPSEGGAEMGRTPIRYVQAIEHLRNYRPAKGAEEDFEVIPGRMTPQVSRKKLTQKVDYIPAATVADLSITNYLNARPITKEEEGLYDFLITPVLRTSDNQDVINSNMYITMTRECLSTFVDNRAALGGGSVFSKLSHYAALCVPGLARDNSNEYTRMFNHLVSINKAGILSGLIGGLIKGVVPGSAGIVDAVSSVLPF